MKYYRIALFIVIILTLYSCRKECRDGELGEIECSDGFYLMEDVYLENMIYHEGFERRKEYIITSKQQLDTLGLGSLWQSVDFTVYDVIGVDWETPNGNNCLRHHWVCKSNDGKVLRLTAEFALSGRCWQSGTDKIPLSFWAKVPKLTEYQSVEFVVRIAN